MERCQNYEKIKLPDKCVSRTFGHMDHGLNLTSLLVSLEITMVSEGIRKEVEEFIREHELEVIL
jgi:hypothetical protein